MNEITELVAVETMIYQNHYDKDLYNVYVYEVYLTNNVLLAKLVGSYEVIKAMINSINKLHNVTHPGEIVYYQGRELC